METFKILTFIPRSPFEGGGGGEIVFWNTMVELSKRGHEIHIVLGKTLGSLPQITGVVLHEGTKSRGTVPLDIITSYDWWKKSLEIKDIDIIHGYKSEMILNSIYWGKLKKKVLIHEVHFPRLYPYSFKDIKEKGILNQRAIRWSIYLHIDKYASKFSTKTVVPSNYSKEELMKVYGVDEGKISVAYPGVDTNVFYDWGLKRDENKLVTVGRLEPQKGLDTLLLAFKEVLQDYPNLVLDIVGREGSKGYEKYLKSICVKEGITDKVKFYGFLKSEEVARLLNNASIFVLPSRIESFGIVLAEAMACGLPIISTNTGAIPEVIIDKETGFLVVAEDSCEIAKKIKELLGDNSLRESMGKNGIKRVKENFTWTKRAELIEKLYSLVIP